MSSAPFTLMLDIPRTVAELLAECPQCRVLTSQVLELAWRAKVIVCRECLRAISLDAEVLEILRVQAADVIMAPFG